MASYNNRKGTEPEGPYSRDELRLLKELSPPVEVSEACVQAVLRDAVGLRQVGARPRRGWGGTRRLAAASLVFLAAAGVWKWSGVNSDDLDLKSTLQVLDHPRLYTEDTLLAAICKVDREVVGLFRSLASNRLLSKALLRKCSHAFSASDAMRGQIVDGDAVAQLKAQVIPLTTQQEKSVLEVLKSCSGTLQAIASNSEACEIYASIARENIEAQLAKSSGF